MVADAAMNVGLQQRSLQLSQEELKKRIEIFDAKIKEIEQEKVKMGDLLAGDRKRTGQRLEDLAETLRREARRYLRALTDAAFDKNADPIAAEQEARGRIADEIPVFFQAKLASFSNEMGSALHEALLPHQERLELLIGTIRSTAAELFDIPYRAAASDGKLERLHKPYWVTQKWNTSVSPVPEGFLDRFLPPELKKHRTQKRLSEEIETLVVHNVENIRWATLRNLDDAFRRFSSILDERLHETAEATRAAMRAAHLRRKESEDTVKAEVKCLDDRSAELQNLENGLAQFAESL